MREAYNRLKIQNVDILGVLMDFNTLEYNNKYLLEHLDEKYQYPWKSGVLFRNDFNDRVMKFYQAYELPATVLISPLGTIIATGLSSLAEIEAAVNNYRKEIDNVPLKSIGDRNKGR